MTPKRVLLVLLLVAGGVMILGWSQDWFVVMLQDWPDTPVPGRSVGGAALATGLATLAVAAASTIAPRVLRYLLGAIAVLLGGIALTATALLIADPIAAVTSTVTTETGIGGGESVASIIDSIAVQVWPWVTIAGGVLVILAGIGVLVTARRWPTAGARYDRAPAERDPWSALSEGDDPTR
jgi:hypothetical protein